ncbi:MAG: hypothetical protein ACYCYF_01605 [Anaerolineae bacterium]
MSGGKLILWGLVGVLLGFALPLLMVLDYIEPSFLLGFLSFAASVGGLTLGMIGSASYARSRQK